MLIDSHAHLNDPRLIQEVSDIAADMEYDNLSHIINVGYDRESSEVSVSFANKYPNIYAAVGIHPHDSKDAGQADYQRFEQLANHEKVVAIGEIGLDFYYDHSPREVQERVFLEQLELAHACKLPAVIHLRDAYGLMLRLLKENRTKLEYGAVLHCYSGSLEMLAEFSRLNLYFSYGGAITFKSAVEKREIVRATPADRLLIETDCPYMTPVPHRGEVNYPKYVNLVADRVAEILGLSFAAVEERTVANTKEFFKKLV